MIVYSNIQRFDNLEFDNYLQLGGYSFSYLKREQMGILPEFKQTPKTILGKLVDALLTETGPVDMSHDLYPAAKAIAFEIRHVFGSFITRLEKQISFSGDLTYQGFTIRTTGRCDYILPKHAVIDLKVTHEKDVDGLIRHMKYNDQLWNYANLAEVKRKYIMIYSVPLKKAMLKDMGVVSPRNEFWEDKVLKFGSIVEAAK